MLCKMKQSSGPFQANFDNIQVYFRVLCKKTNNIVRVLRGLLVRVADGQAKEGSDNDTDAFVSRYNNGFGYYDAADMV